MGTGANQADRRDFDTAASQNAQDNFNRVAAQLEALIAQRDGDVKAAMADYQADGVSEEYAAKERRWNAVAGEVRTIISTLRSSLQQNDETATSTMSRAKSAVDNIG
ncbi:pore-forming ESAT-6 family protein [Sinomonas sp. G460-2]|uniref:pore-forming ESAT-6 family protein n=1 Tax=Sinomonas sp. G460-2 TaxID=3393464 RepID=UPI0039EEE047